MDHVHLLAVSLIRSADRKERLRLPFIAHILPSLRFFFIHFDILEIVFL